MMKPAEDRDLDDLSAELGADSDPATGIRCHKP
jgi:hypothetical protein